jgi:predicted permease
VSEVVNTIAPIFAIVFLGTGLGRLGLLPGPFQAAANRLVYYVAIPAMIFRVIAGAPFAAGFNAALILGTLIPPVLVAALALPFVKLPRMGPSRRATFVHSSFHGNLGYVGLAVVFYHLGEQGLALAGILSGFLMLAQNVLAVFVLGTTQGRDDEDRAPNSASRFKSLILHPVILSVAAGMVYSFAGPPMPNILENGLKILGDMALPLALLLIGGSLSIKQVASLAPHAAASGIIKLMFMPLAGLIGYELMGLGGAEYLPGLILLAAPTATVTYVMGRQMGGDPDLASACISASTLGSALTYVFWISIA